MAPTTPAASRVTQRLELPPKAVPFGRSRLHSNWSMYSAGHRSASPSGASSWGHGALHVLRRRVGHRSEHLFGGRVDVVERLARRRLDELAVDEHADLALHGCGAIGFSGGHDGAPRLLFGA